MMVQEKAHDKIRKLLKLAQSDNANEAEMAAARAQELMIYHEIDASDIDLSEGEQSRPKEDIEQHMIDEGRRRRIIWKGSLAGQLGAGFNCRMYWQGKRTYLVGRPSDIQTVSYLYDYLVHELQRLAGEAFAAYKAAGGTGHGKTWKTNFYDSAAYSIGARLEEQRKEIFAKVRTEGEAEVRVEGCTALARVREVDRMEAEGKEVDDYYDNVVFKGRRGTGVAAHRSELHMSAHQAGHAAGRSVRLSGGRPLAKGKDSLKS